jgi:hypothetical protein
VNAQPIISDWQLAALLAGTILVPAALTLWAMISDAREARRRRSLAAIGRPPFSYSGKSTDARIARQYYDNAIRCHRAGAFTLARQYSRLAGELLGVELAAPVSLALGGVR